MPTAAERRAARKARILQQTDKRMDLVSGVIDTLKEEDEQVPTTSETTTKDNPPSTEEGTVRRVNPSVRRRQAAERKKKKMEEMVQAQDETEQDLQTTATSEKQLESEEGTKGREPEISKSEDTSVSSVLPNEGSFRRVDPSLRRRQAAERKKKKLEELDDTRDEDEQEPSESAKEATTTAEEDLLQQTSTETAPLITEKAAGKTQTLHQQLLYQNMCKVQSNIRFVLLLVVGSILALSSDTMHLRIPVSISTPETEHYAELLSQGVSPDSIYQQMERENLDPTIVLGRAGRPKVSEAPWQRSWFIDSIPFLIIGLVLTGLTEVGLVVARQVASIPASVVESVHKAQPIKSPFGDAGWAKMIWAGILSSNVLGNFPQYFSRVLSTVEDLCVLLFAFVLTTAAIVYCQEA